MANKTKLQKLLGQRVPILKWLLDGYIEINFYLNYFQKIRILVIMNTAKKNFISKT